jgi:hypothetical protein
MTQAEDVGRLAVAWRATPGKVFDFSESQDRIEVKAAGAGAREHYFSFAHARDERKCGQTRIFRASSPVLTSHLGR